MMSSDIQTRKRRRAAAGPILPALAKAVRALVTLHECETADPKLTRDVLKVLRLAAAYGGKPVDLLPGYQNTAALPIVEAAAVLAEAEQSSPEAVRQLRRLFKLALKTGFDAHALATVILRQHENEFGPDPEGVKTDAKPEKAGPIQPEAVAADPSSSGAMTVASDLSASSGEPVSPNVETGARSSAEGDNLTVVDPEPPARERAPQGIDNGDDPTATALASRSETDPAPRDAKKGRAKARRNGGAARDFGPAKIQPKSDGNGTQPSASTPTASDNASQGGSAETRLPKPDAGSLTQESGRSPTDGLKAKNNMAFEASPDQLSMFDEPAAWTQGRPGNDAVGGGPG